MAHCCWASRLWSILSFEILPEAPASLCFLSQGSPGSNRPSFLRSLSTVARSTPFRHQPTVCGNGICEALDEYPGIGVNCGSHFNHTTIRINLALAWELVGSCPDFPRDRSQDSATDRSLVLEACQWGSGRPGPLSCDCVPEWPMTTISCGGCIAAKSPHYCHLDKALLKLKRSHLGQVEQRRCEIDNEPPAHRASESPHPPQRRCEIHGLGPLGESDSLLAV
jgi:hypothetical protein